MASYWSRRWLNFSGSEAVESIRRPSGRRNLLPAEVALCEFIGITEQDYWEFCVYSAGDVKANEARSMRISP